MNLYYIVSPFVMVLVKVSRSSTGISTEIRNCCFQHKSYLFKCLPQHSTLHILYQVVLQQREFPQGLFEYLYMHCQWCWLFVKTLVAQERVTQWSFKLESANEDNRWISQNICIPIGMEFSSSHSWLSSWLLVFPFPAHQRTSVQSFVASHFSCLAPVQHSTTGQCV